MIKKAKKSSIVSINLKPRTIYILRRLGYIDGRYKARGGYGKLSEFINSCILNTFSKDGELEVIWNKYQIQEAHKKIDNINKEITTYVGNIQRLKTIEKMEIKKNEQTTKII